MGAARIFVHVKWAPRAEPAHAVPPLAIAAYRHKLANRTPPPAPPPPDTALTPLERQGVVDPQPHDWEQYGADVHQCITLSTLPVHPERDIEGTGSYCIHAEAPLPGPATAAHGRVTHVYKPDGTWAGQLSHERLAILYTRFQHTHRTKPWVFRSLGCQPGDFIKEVAQLLERWRAQRAKARKEGRNLQQQQQHCALTPALTRALITSLHIDTELYAHPLNFHPAMTTYYSRQKEDQLFGASLDACSIRWEGASYAHPPHSGEDPVTAIRWALASARTQKQRPVLTAIVLPGWADSAHSPYLAAPEVRIVGEFARDQLSLLLPAENWTRSSETEWPQSTPRLTLALVGNDLGYQGVDLTQLCHALKNASEQDYKFGWLDSLPWASKHAAAAAADIEQSYAEKCGRWINVSEADKHEIYSVPREFSRGTKRRDFPPASATPDLLDEDSVHRACTFLAEELSRHVRFKYAWQDAHYTDGSARDDQERGRLLGAAVWRSRDEQSFLIRPTGHGVTNTINRGELSAIYHVLADLSDPDEDVLIFTDSQVSIQLINRILRRPCQETGVHRDLLIRIAEKILSRAQGGRRTSIHKVQSHIGITGNEAADRAAKDAAENPDRATLQTPASHPFQGRWWPILTPLQPAEGQERAVSNLGKSLKHTVRHSTKLGRSNQDSYYVRTTQAMYADPLGAHPQASNAFWGSNKCTHPSKSLALKARLGTLFTRARAKMMGFTPDDCCPLCKDRDSIGHMLGRCRHRAMGALYISRHDDAVTQLYRALQKGNEGGIFTIIDAGKMRDVMHTLAADGKRVPHWLLPDVEEDTLRRMRPDILRIKNLPAHATAAEIQQAHLNKAHHKIQIIEVGYTSDFRWKEKLEEKKAQHQTLIQALRDNQWEVEEHYIVLGSKGAIYNDTLTTLQTLGLRKAQALALMCSLHIHAINYLATIVRTRRHLEYTPSAPVTQQGIG